MTSKTAGGLPSENSSSSFWHSEPSQLLLGHRSTTDLPQQADVVIVGSGIAGTGAAWNLLRGSETTSPSPSVVMLEAREACWGATGRNGGHCYPIVYHHPSDASIGHFELRNLHAIDAVVKEQAIECEWYVQPSVRGIYSDKEVEEAKKSLATLQETDPTLMAHLRWVTDPTELKTLRIPSALAAIWCDTAARMWPYKFVTHLLEQLVSPTDQNLQNGSFNLQTHTPVTSLSRADEVNPSATGPPVWKLTTPRGTIVTSHVILATNAYTTHLLPDFSDLIVPCRGQMSALNPPPDASDKERTTSNYVFLGHGFYDYLVQRPNELGGHLMFGGAGKKGSVLNTFDDSTIDGEAATYLRHRLYPFLGLNSDSSSSSEKPELKATHEWTGIMGLSRDNNPWVGPLSSHPGVFLAAGFTGHGMPNAFLCGKATAIMVQERRKGKDAKAAVQAAIDHEDIELPSAYLVTKERMEHARTMDSVERQEELEGF